MPASTTTKKPHASAMGPLRRRLFSRKAQSLRQQRVAWLTAFCRSQWRDRGRFSRPSPLPLPAKWKHECKASDAQSQLKQPRPDCCRVASAVLPIGFAFFHQRAQPFLRVLELIKFIQKNAHGFLERVAKGKTHAA